MTPPECSRCGMPFEYDMGEDAHCGECIRQLPLYDSAKTVLVFDDTSKLLVHKLKFEDETYLATIFSAWLVAKLGDMPPLDMVIPVPLSRKRLFTRRYNQSALLAREVAKKLAIPYQPSHLIRRYHTPPQTGLNRAQRQENVSGAFIVPDQERYNIEGKSILLIDDVMTTGATINACSKALRKAKAAQVHVLTLTRVVRG